MACGVIQSIHQTNGWTFQNWVDLTYEACDLETVGV